ncbi:Septum site-determining protein MinC [Serratia entomophila]|jgi:septum site-determining protein MinC|uniref:Probable septum site-determining protein MinC n=1 Tax=Serratia entomophila TaxID=42906 RepID=A0ABY5CMT0_9GAMM|nr:septum site-determining protein MinC [Serratia entomophila]UIW16481.1 septum site-determining protein MinC [Serratia entomophila]USU99039.1 septum site-determining protein MinC [Serratia entomophila]CAI0772332.1 Septum site-determining protein MinC [Serratia entomophila]CAI1013297.1 Septum site-determining protein MinC [Serratia entomophila]CAI1107040.1 Septum site-determining protein MinC [Serratia entomophila]
MSQSPIELKGSSFTLSVVHLHNSEPEVIRQALLEKVEQAPAFLKNAPVVINVATLNGDANWKELQQAVAAAGLRVVGISGCRDERQKRAIARAGLPLLSEGKGQKMAAPEPAPAPAPVVENAPAKTRIISTPVRSGQQIYARNSDLIVTSSVSAGAEIIADGNIHIYGMMRGRALAGASGDTQCQIFCTHLGAELVSIAGQYWLSDQIPSDFVGQAVRLSLLDNALTIQPLN